MMPKTLPRGPVMADVESFRLTDEEKERLLDPAIGGVILFRRNFQDREQLTLLVQEIKALRQPPLIVAVDHEGGRVQRFITGFTRLPAMRVLGEMWDGQGAEAAKERAETVGWVLAAELAACGIDLSFTPVLDLDWGNCAVIGNRSFHKDADVVIELALALQRGLNRGGMKSCGKHFPGHGFVGGDSTTHAAWTNCRRTTCVRLPPCLPQAWPPSCPPTWCTGKSTAALPAFHPFGCKTFCAAGSNSTV